MNVGRTSKRQRHNSAAAKKGRASPSRLSPASFVSVPFGGKAPFGPSLPLKSTFPGFLLRFAVFFGLPYLALLSFPFFPLLNAIALVESAALAFFGISSSVFGNVLSSNALWFEIVPSCSGLVMVLLLFGLLFSTPVRQPLRFFAIFAPALFVFNLLRLFAVLAVGGLYGAGAMDAAHVLLWFVDAGLVLFLWFVAFSVGQKGAASRKNGNAAEEKKDAETRDARQKRSGVYPKKQARR